MFKDSPDGQTHCYTPEEEMRMEFDAWNEEYGYIGAEHVECTWTAWQAATETAIKKKELGQYIVKNASIFDVNSPVNKPATVDYKASAQSKLVPVIHAMTELLVEAFLAGADTKQGELDAAETRSRIDAANANSVVKQIAQANATIAALTSGLRRKE